MLAALFDVTSTNHKTEVLNVGLILYQGSYFSSFFNYPCSLRAYNNLSSSSSSPGPLLLHERGCGFCRQLLVEFTLHLGLDSSERSGSSEKGHRSRAVPHDGGRAVRDGPQVLLRARRLRRRDGDLGRRKPRDLLPNVDVRRSARVHSLFFGGPYLPVQASLRLSG